MTRGRPINNAIVDPTGTLALRVCTGGLASGLASPSRPWFKMIPALHNFKTDAAGKKWFDDTENRIYTALAGSNFYDSFVQECEDLIAFGTAPVIIYEDAQDLLRGYNPAVGEYYLSSSATNRVNGLYRLFVQNVAQIVDFFKLENCPAEIQKLWVQKGSALEQERIIGHSIEPNFGIGDKDAGKIPGAFTWRETYWVYGSASEKPLSLHGFVDQPFTASRWATQSNDAYGRSQGMDVLPDIMQLQQETRRKAEAIEKNVRPPLLAHVSLKNQPASQLPGHLTYSEEVGPGRGMRSIYDVTLNIADISNDIALLQARIKTGFFNDLFLMLENKVGKMTAYEVAQKMQEKMQVLGPVIESLLAESLKPKLKRIYGILKRKGFIDEPPDSLKGQPLDFQFVSVLALAQKAAATGSIERLLALVGSMYQVFPEVKDNINPDEVVNQYSVMLGVPQSILFDDKEIAGVRQQRAQQQAAAQKMAIQQHIADTASTGADAAQTLSQIPMGNGASALSQMMGGGAQ
jgi:hypothetical protein